MKKEKISKIAPSFDKHEKLFGNPLCSECREEMVKFRGKWLCGDCMKIEVQAIPGWDAEEVSFKYLYPNREARRKKYDRY